MAKRRPKSEAHDSHEAADAVVPNAGAAGDDPSSFDPSTFDAPATDTVALAVADDGTPPLPHTRPPEPPPAAEAADAGLATRAAVSVDPDGRVTYTVPADATSEPTPAPAPNPGGDGEADKGFPNPFGVRADHEAKVGLLEDRRFKQMQIKFDAKPSEAVRQILREAGWQWRSQQQAWTRQIDADAAWRTRAEATALFDRVAGMVRDELGIGREVG